MRIGIDGTTWENQRGFGRFTRGLLRGLLDGTPAHHYTVFFDGAIPSEARFALPNVTVVQIATRAKTIAACVATGHRRVADIAACTFATAAHPCEVFLFPAIYSWYPLRPGQKSVVTVHDAIAEAFPELVFPARRARFFWAAKVRAALWQATRVLTVSESAKRDVVRHLKVAPARIDVTSEAADAHFRPGGDPAAIEAALRGIGLPSGARFLLFVGGLAPHKNLLLLLQGFAHALTHAGVDDLYLVIAGDPGGAGFNSCADEVHRVAENDAKLRERVLFPGFVSDNDLTSLYTSALALVMPSLSEGFGLPAIEAMACGAPVLSSTTGAVPEVVGDAGALFDPHSPAALAAEIVRLALDPALHARLRANALSRAAGFSWARCASLTMASLERAVGRG